MRTLSLLLLLFLSVAYHTIVMATPIKMIWDNSPIPIELPIKTEQRIDFPETIVQLDVPDELDTLSSLHLSRKGVLLITIDNAITSSRLYATSVTGSVYLLDITASDAASHKHITIVDPVIEQVRKSLEQTTTDIPEFLTQQPDRAENPPSYVELSQFALAHHIGPERLIPELANVSHVAIAPVDLEHFIRFNHDVKVEPLRQWKIGDLYITTVRAINQGRDRYQFDPRGLRGQFMFAATASMVLEPLTTRIGHETVWSLISKRPFSLAVGG